jgi:hypothetical protein
MTRLQFEIKHGHLPAGCCYLGWCGRAAKRDTRSITLTRRESNWLKPPEEPPAPAPTGVKPKLPKLPAFYQLHHNL